jgi:transposase
MERLYQRVAGIDISRDFVDVHIRACDPETAEISRSRRRFSSMTDGLVECGDWLVENRIELVVMEATGIYWRSPFAVLEPVIDEVWVLNAHHVKNVPGRKTDMADAEWLADVAAHGMVRPSFIPPAPIRELRELTRFRANVARSRSQATTRIEKMLQDAGIKITSVTSTVLGVSTREMLKKLIAGERDPNVLADCARGRMRPKVAELAKALVGNFGSHHAVAVDALLDQVDLFDSQIARLNTEISTRLDEYRDAKDLLVTIPGVADVTASAIISEIGLDMTKFPTPGHLSALAGLAPANAESGGKRRPAGTRRAGPHLRTIMVQVAWAAVRVKGSYHQTMFGRIRARRGPKVAIIAVARKLMEATWHVIGKGVAFVDLGGDYYDKRRDPRSQTRHLVAKLEKLGHSVSLTPALQQQT